MRKKNIQQLPAIIIITIAGFLCMTALCIAVTIPVGPAYGNSRVSSSGNNVEAGHGIISGVSAISGMVEEKNGTNLVFYSAYDGFFAQESQDDLGLPWISSEYIPLRGQSSGGDKGMRGLGLDGFVVMISSVIPRPVPEPVTMILFGSGLIGVTGIFLRRKNAKN